VGLVRVMAPKDSLGRVVVLLGDDVLIWGRRGDALADIRCWLKPNRMDEGLLRPLRRRTTLPRRRLRKNQRRGE
jgi:thiamine monophosphate kinase